MLAIPYHEIGLRSQIPMSNDLKGHESRSPPCAFAGSFIVEYLLSQKDAIPMTSCHSSALLVDRATTKHN
jgi:hypothetical protein